MKKYCFLFVFSMLAFMLSAQPTPTNVALNKTATGNMTNLTKITDSDVNTYAWATITQIPTPTVIIDLAGTYYLEKMTGADLEVKMDVASGCYTVSVSSDGTNYFNATYLNKSGSNTYNFEVNNYVKKIKIVLIRGLGDPNEFRIYDVKAWGYATPALGYYSRVGIGTTTLTEHLNINGNATVKQLTATEITVNGVINGQNDVKAMAFVDKNNSNYFLWPANPNVSLRVAGKIFSESKIECKEFEVKEIVSNSIETNEIRTNTLNVKVDNVADYVFDENYQLNSIEELSEYIKENKHLPGLPTATELEQNGMDVAEMNNLLLEKIEELTLYIIELKKENEEIKGILNTMNYK